MEATETHGGTCYRLAGDLAANPVLVLVHGVGLDQDMWLPWVPVLGPKFRILTYDLYGHGGSHNPEGPRTVRDFVDQLDDLLDHLGIVEIALAGFSLGAVISQAYASRFAERLTHLVLLHSVYQRTEAQCQAVRERYAITRDQGPMATVEMAIKRWYTESYRLDNPDEMDRLRAVFARHTGDGYLKAYDLFGHAEAEMQHYPVDGVTCPALVVTGSDDTGSTPAMSRKLARDMANSKLVINPLHRHMGPAEFAPVIARQVLSFLTK